MTNPSVDLFSVESGHGFPLVLVHGYPLDHTTWDDVSRLLQTDARVIRPDLRGYGRSPVTSGVYSMRLLADDLLSFIDGLGLEKVILAGHSMGGYVSLAFAQAYPDRLEGLALVTSQAAADTPEKRKARLQQALDVEEQGVIAAVEAGLSHYSTAPQVLEKTRVIMMQADARAVAGSLRGMAERPDMTEFLGELRIPTVVIAGEVDEIIPVKKSEEMSAVLKNGRLVVVKGAGHMAMMEAPKEVADALRELATRVK